MTFIDVNMLEAIKYPPEQVQWVIDQIAIFGLVPTKQGNWAGKTELVDRVTKHFEFTLGKAKALVDRSTELLWDQSTDQPADVARRIMIRKLQLIIQQLTQHLVRKKTKKTYAIKNATDKHGVIIMDKGGRCNRRRVLTEVVTEEGLDTAVAARLLDFYDRLNALMGVHERKDDKAMRDQLFATLEASKNSDKAHGNGITNIENLQINVGPKIPALGPDGMKSLQRAIDEAKMRDNRQPIIEEATNAG